MTGVLVLITGAGRSGTSTMSGCLHHLGLLVPGPFLKANASNPKGFFESAWSVSFHNDLIARAGIAMVDSRPEAFDQLQGAITPEDRAALVAFLATQAAASDQVVVKDPRSVWTQSLWRQAAEQVGLRTCVVTMLRHPAEVVGSRASNYGPDQVDERRRYQVSNVARWVNHSLISERQTRGWPRAFVHYADLLDDWRGVAARLSDELGLVYDSPLDPEVPHELDEFVDPGLRRNVQTWDDLQTPLPLRDVAQAVWEVLDRTADSSTPSTSHRLDELREAYDQAYRSAEDLVDDAVAAAHERGRRTGAEEARQAAAADRRAGDLPLPKRPVEQVAARDLLRVVAGRARRRLRRGR